jgi:hypothetical protein
VATMLPLDFGKQAQIHMRAFFQRSTHNYTTTSGNLFYFSGQFLNRAA